MVITLVLKPETEALLMAQAAEKGVSVEQYLQTWIETSLIDEVEPPVYQAETTREWVDAFAAWAKSHSSDAPPLSDEAISRENIYREREDCQL